MRALHGDVAHLLLPTAARDVDLDRAYRSIVEAQAFTRGRDPILAPSENIHRKAPIGEPTGIVEPVAFARLAGTSEAARPGE